MLNIRKVERIFVDLTRDSTGREIWRDSQGVEYSKEEISPWVNGYPTTKEYIVLLLNRRARDVDRDEFRNSVSVYCVYYP